MAALTFVGVVIVVDNSSLDAVLRAVSTKFWGLVLYLNTLLPWWAEEVLTVKRNEKRDTEGGPRVGMPL